MGNVNQNPDQSNTLAGSISAIASVDLTGKRSYLGVLINDSGTPKVKLPTAITEKAIYLIDDEGEAGDVVPLSPLTPGENFRVRAKGTGVAGDELVLADTSTAGDRGKLRKLPTAAGTYWVLGIAEESFADGGLPLVRPIGPYPVTVSA